MAPLKFLFVNYEYPPIGGGGGTCSRFLARELVALGHEVRVVTSHYGRLPRRHSRGGLTVVRLPVLRKKPGQSNPLEMMSYVAMAAPYLLLAGGPRPDVAVSFHTIPSGLAAIPYCLMRGVPHVALFRGGDVPGWLPGKLALYHRATLPLNRWIVRTSAAALANSNGLRQLALESFPEKEIGVLPNGVDVRTFSPDAARTREAGSPVRLLFVGRVTEQKGIDLLLAALADPSVAARSWQLEVVGDGPMLDEYFQLAQDLGLAERVQFHGWKSRSDVRRLYREADVLVHPSRSEGMPNVVLEAMACGLPVIGTRIAGTEQLVSDGVTGLLIARDDGAALRAALRRLLDDPNGARLMGRRGRREVVRNWSWTASAHQLAELARDLTTQRKGSRR